MKKILIATLTLLILAGCSSSGVQSQNGNSKAKKWVLDKKVEVFISDRSFETSRNSEEDVIKLYRNNRLSAWINWSYSEFDTDILSPRMLSLVLLRTLKEDNVSDGGYKNARISKRIDFIAPQSLEMESYIITNITKNGRDSKLKQLLYITNVESGYLTVISTIADDKYEDDNTARSDAIMKSAKLK